MSRLGRAQPFKPQYGSPRGGIGYFYDLVYSKIVTGLSRIQLTQAGGAATQGPNSPATAATDSSIGTIGWAGITNIFVSDGVYASADFGSGIGTRSITDNSIKLIKGGVISGNDLADSVTVWPATEAYVGYGSSNNLWGLALSPADINSPTFGLAISAICHNTTGVTYYLKATNFGFSIPSGSTINGVFAEIEKYDFSVCFLAGTKISTPTGQKNIEDIKVGEFVIGYNTLTKKRKNEQVTKTFKHQTDGYLVLYTKNSSVKTTNEHPFLTISGWKSAGELNIGDELVTINGSEELIKKENIKDDVTVYNLEVDELHTYIANDFVVHNKPGGGDEVANIDHVRITVYYTLPNTINGVGKILATTRQTIIGTSRLTNTAQVGEFGIARIQQSQLKTISGLSRIGFITPKTETGLARIALVTAKTESGVARITASTSKIITGKGAILRTTARTENGTARVQITTTKTETGVGRIQISSTKTVTGLTRVAIVTIKTQTGIARITTRTAKTENGVANIKNTTGRTEIGQSRITQSTLKTESGLARVTSSSSQNEIGKSRITAISSETEQGKARIGLVTPKIEQGVAFVGVVTRHTETGIGRVEQSATRQEQGVSRVEQTINRNETGIAMVKQVMNIFVTGVAHIVNIVLRTINGTARITKSIDQDTSGRAAIIKTSIQNINGVAAIAAQQKDGKERYVLTNTSPMATLDSINTSKIVL